MKTLLIFLFSITVGFAQTNDTVYYYYDGNNKILDLKKLGPKDEIVLPIYKGRYFYDEKSKKYIEVRCRLEESQTIKRNYYDHRV